MNSDLSQSLEDYLLATLILSIGEGSARVKDIAAHVGVRMPSVTEAVKKLIAKGLAAQEGRGRVRLTGDGLIAAQDLQRRRTVLIEFFTLILGLHPHEVKTDIHNIEHHLSEITVQRLRNLVDFLMEDKELMRKLQSKATGRAARQVPEQSLHEAGDGQRVQVVENGSEALRQIGINKGEILAVERAGAQDRPMVVMSRFGRLILGLDEAKLVR